MDNSRIALCLLGVAGNPHRKIKYMNEIAALREATKNSETLGNWPWEVLPSFTVTYKGKTYAVEGGWYNWGKIVASYLWQVSESADPNIQCTDENLRLAAEIIVAANLDNIGTQRWMRALSNYAIYFRKDKKHVLDLIGKVYGGIIGIPLSKIALFILVAGAIVGGLIWIFTRKPVAVRTPTVGVEVK